MLLPVFFWGQHPNFEKVLRLFPKVNTLLTSMFSLPVTHPGAHVCTHKEKNSSSINQAKALSFFEKKCHILALQGYIFNQLD